MRKSTENLMNELQGEDCAISDFIKNNPDSFIHIDIKNFWEDVIARSGMSKSNIINKSNFSYCYFYDIINGRKIPGREKIFRLAITIGLDLEEVQEALRLSGKSALYPRIKRDSIIIYAINQKITVDETNKLLSQFKEQII